MQLFSFVILCLIWGTTWLAIKYSLEGLPPFLGAAFRFIIASLALFVFILFKKISLRIDKKDIKYLLITAFLMYVFDYGLIFWGEQYINAGVAAIFFSTF